MLFCTYKILIILLGFFIANGILALEVSAAPLLFRGFLVVNKVSGKACTSDAVGKKHTVELVLDKNDEGYSGYFGAGNRDLGTGRFAGKSLEQLSVEYGFPDKLLAEGHSLTLSQVGGTLTGILRERHLDDTSDNCNNDEASISLTQAPDDESAWKNFSMLFEAESLMLHGYKLVLEGNTTDALLLLDKALKILEGNTAGTLPLLEKALKYIDRLAHQFNASGRYAEAGQLYVRALAIREKVYGEEHFRTAVGLNYLGILYITTGRYIEAELILKRALAIREKTFGLNHQKTATSLQNLAVLYEKTGHYAEADLLYKRALAIEEKVLGLEHPDIATLLNNLASLYSTIGHYAEAEPLYKRALAIRENAIGEEHRDTAVSLDNLAVLYATTGRYVEAELHYKRALGIRVKVLGPDHPDKANSLNNLASLFKTTGRYSEAEQFYKRALAINEKTLGLEHPETANLINNLASLYDDATGRYTEAEPLYKRALVIREKVLGPEHPGTANSLNNLAMLYHTTGRYTEAEPLYKRALAINEKILGPDHNYTALFLGNLASLYDSTGRYAEAERLFIRSLGIEERVFGVEHPKTAGSLHNLARLYYTTGRYAEAELLFNRSLKIALNSGKPVLLSTIQGSYSQFLAKQNNPTAAIFFAKQAINITQSLRQNVSGIGKETLKSFDKTVEDKYQRLADLLIEQGRLAEAQQVLSMLKEEEYFDFIRRDAGTANKLTTRTNFIAPEEPWLREYETISAHNAKLGKEIGELRGKAKYYPLSDEEKTRLATLTQEDSKATAAFNDFLTRLIKGMKEEAKTDADRLEDIGAKGLKTLITLKSTLKTLGEGSVLLQYVIWEQRVHILLTTQDTLLARRSLIKSADLNKKIFALRETITNTKLDPRPLAKELYDILLAPVAKDLEASKAKTLMLSLVGSLRYLPFGVLHDGRSYVAENYRTVMYAEAAKGKVVLPAMAQWKVAALGVSDKVHSDFLPLPGVTDEILGIVRNETGGVIPGEIRMNKNFTEVSMTETSLRNPVVHIASHFKFSPGTERDSFLLLGDGSTMSLDKLRNGSFFQETELLTLSACETAMGTTGKGIEIEGFGAIAMNQGAKSVIATLWPVSDKSTALLMKEFYRLKEEKKLPKIEALRLAQMALLRGEIKDDSKTENSQERGSDRKRFEGDSDRPYSHPYYWAPFILMGNWK